MTKESSSNDIPYADFDDSINLESKVLLALSRLQNKKTACKKPQEGKAVSCGNVVQFLKANYSWLDGDIQSQVKTVLLSFIKTGIVCVMDNAKYRLLVPNSKVMTSACSTRMVHGPHCCCLFTLKCVLKNPPNVCCLLKEKNSQRKKINHKKNKKKTTSSRGGNVRCSSKKNERATCLLNIKNSFNGAKRKISSPKCAFCLEVHAQKPIKSCDNCNNDGTVSNIPDVFSPRDEVVESS